MNRRAPAARRLRRALVGEPPPDEGRDVAGAAVLRECPQLVREVYEHVDGLRTPAGFLALTRGGPRSLRAYLEVCYPARGLTRKQLGGDANCIRGEFRQPLLHKIVAMARARAFGHQWSPADVVAAVQLALQCHVDVAARPSLGWTSLATALFVNAPARVAELLVAHGASIRDASFSPLRRFRSMVALAAHQDSTYNLSRLERFLHAGADPFFTYDDAWRIDPTRVAFIETFRHRYRVVCFGKRSGLLTRKKLALLGANLPRLTTRGALHKMVVQQTGVPARVLALLL